MEPINPVGKVTEEASFIDNFLKKLAQEQIIETSPVRTEEYSMPVTEIAGGTALGEGNFIRPSDSARAFQKVISNLE